MTVGAATTVSWAAGYPASRTYSFFTGTQPTSTGSPTADLKAAEAQAAGAALDRDHAPVELGLKFASSQSGRLTAVRFLQPAEDAGEHRVSIWSATGRRLATAVAPAQESTAVDRNAPASSTRLTVPATWREVALPAPVALTAGKTYTVSYHANRYMSTLDYFQSALRVGPLSAPARSNGVYAYGAGAAMPARSWRASNYWVDVVVATTAGSPTGPDVPNAPTGPPATTAPTGVPTAPTGPPTTAPAPSRTGGPVKPPPAAIDLPRVPWDGGPDYYARFPATKPWTDPNFFPVGVWFEGVHSQADVALDKGAGLNTYVALTKDSNLNYIRNAGMYAIDWVGRRADAGTESVGQLLTDEADMNYGAGWDAWTGKEGWNTCQPTQDKGGKCGYTVMKSFVDRAAKDGGPLYANYGKGVTMWESDKEAATFVNQFQNLVSADMYFYTDPNLCPGEAQRFLNIPPQNCRRSASYGVVVDRMRKLDGVDGQRQPIWAFVEDGHPFTESGAPTITGDQAAGAVMNSIIHDARGVIYFNHNFGGGCISQHVLRDCGATSVRPKITETNSRIAALAPVLNTQSYQWTFNPSLDTMLKARDGAFYVFAMPGRNGGTGTQTLTLPAGISGARAEVMFENRTVPVTNGAFTDSFAQEFSYHIYKITT